MTDADTIRALLDDRDAAIGAADAEAATAHGAAGGVTYDLQPPLAYAFDRQSAIADLQGWFAAWDGPIALQSPDPTILTSGDLAVAFGLKRLRGTSKDAGPHESWYRNTVVLARKADRWRIVHEHSSYPTRMDGSLKSAVDLTPEEIVQ